MFLGESRSLHQVYLLWVVTSGFIWLYICVAPTEVEMGVTAVPLWATASGGFWREMAAKPQPWLSHLGIK